MFERLFVSFDFLKRIVTSALHDMPNLIWWIKKSVSFRVPKGGQTKSALINSRRPQFPQNYPIDKDFKAQPKKNFQSFKSTPDKLKQWFKPFARKLSLGASDLTVWISIKFDLEFKFPSRSLTLEFCALCLFRNHAWHRYFGVCIWWPAALTWFHCTNIYCNIFALWLLFLEIVFSQPTYGLKHPRSCDHSCIHLLGVK